MAGRAFLPLFLTAAMSAACGSSPTAPAPKPSSVVIVVDTTRATVQAVPSGADYRIEITMRETGRVLGATFNHATVTFPSGVVGQSGFGSALIPPRIGPGQSNFTIEIVHTRGLGSPPEPSVTVALTWIDDQGATGTVPPIVVSVMPIP